ncbi:hypothetical protein CKM354_000567800 [Cercospora kikuchii]|uniref:Uncharacterized protein n=1 Tax=Cercospora kikuchii TaxID=84275 RepID=A0A9P3FHG4_9PEZI|nr:uncharacterized protein CKM354_000567800 [Cercospora kikuchii]GIZ42405.1 hypothetical protein CKM354_000567800 [Cercospora kikuchii]
MDNRRDVHTPGRPSTSAQHAPQYEKNTTARQICELYFAAIQALNEHDHDHKGEAGQVVLSHLSPNFTARFDAIDKTEMSWKEVNDAWREWHKQDPEMRIEIKHCSCDVDLGRGVAKLLAEADITGISGGVTLGGLMENRYRRNRDGKWMLECSMGLRGLKSNGGFV